jgi:hypothetical protein
MARSRDAASMRWSFRTMWFDVIEAERVSGIASGPGRLLMDFHEHGIDAGGDAGGRQRLDVLSQARRHTVAGSRQLQAVGNVEHNRIPELAEHRKRAHVNDEVVVAEADPPFGDEQPLVPFGGCLRHHVAHVLRRKKLTLLDVDDGAGPRRGDNQVRLARKEGRDLNDVGNRRDRSSLRRFVGCP